jgi:hypothetical protein
MQKYLQKIHNAYLKFEGSNVIPMASNADWSMHQLLEYLLRITGPAKVAISSFSITEVAIRTFLNLKEEGLIQQLDCLFDFTVKQHKAGLLFFTSNVADTISISKCHAKLISIENDLFTLTVVGSPNFNVNDKKEVMVIHSDRWFFDFYYQVLTSWMADGLKIDADEYQ